MFKTEINGEVSDEITRFSITCNRCGSHEATININATAYPDAGLNFFSTINCNNPECLNEETLKTEND